MKKFFREKTRCIYERNWKTRGYVQGSEKEGGSITKRIRKRNGNEVHGFDHKGRKTSVKNKKGSLVMGREAESIEEVMLKNTTNVGTE